MFIDVVQVDSEMQICDILHKSLQLKGLKNMFASLVEIVKVNGTPSDSQSVWGFQVRGNSTRLLDIHQM